MSTITSLGVGSGLDINKTVSDLVASEREPTEKRLAAKEERYNTQFSAYGALQSAVSGFNESLQGLKSASTFEQRTASSSDSTLFSASASSAAQAGSYSLEVVSLAQSHKLASPSDKGWSDSSPVGTGTLSISAGGASFDVDINSENNTLAGIRDAINSADSNSGVTASIIQVDDSNGDTESRLVFTADDAGTDNAVAVTVSGDGDGDDTDAGGLSALRFDDTVTNMSETQAATDAQIKIDGQTATRSTNTLTDVVDGVTINLNKAAAGSVETLTVERNEGDVVSAIEDMVNGYNTLAQTLGQLTNYDSETGEAAVLLGDATARGLETQTRQGLMGSVSGMDGAIQSLMDIGISVGGDGQLSIDKAELNNALKNNPEELKALFTSEDGVGQRLDRITDAYTGQGGIIDNRTDGVENRLDGIAEERETLNRRMANLEQRYLDQFMAMDQIVAQMNSTEDRLTQGLASLPGLVQNDD